MPYIILHDNFEGQTFVDYTDVSDAIVEALTDEDITISEAEELDVYKIKNPLGVSVEVTFNVSIG